MRRVYVAVGSLTCKLLATKSTASTTDATICATVFVTRNMHRIYVTVGSLTCRLLATGSTASTIDTTVSATEATFLCN